MKRKVHQKWTIKYTSKLQHSEWAEASAQIVYFCEQRRFCSEQCVYAANPVRPVSWKKLKLGWNGDVMQHDETSQVFLVSFMFVLNQVLLQNENIFTKIYLNW